MIDSLRRRRQQLDRQLSARGLAHTVSLPPFLLERELRPLLAEVSGARVLDAGSGRSPYLERLRALGSTVLSLDIENRSGAVDLIADLQHMPEVQSGSFDIVLCTQVLEHLPRPGSALSELCRVLRPGGRLILSVPHLSPIHEAPADFFRYTPFGLRFLAETAGLAVVEIRPVGGLLAFFGHLASIALLGATAAIPGAGRLGWWSNYVLLVRALAPLDRWLGLRSVLPCNLLLLARKPA